MENQQLVLNHILNKDPTELYYIERTVFRKDVNTNKKWTFELGNSGESTPTYVVVGFQARKKLIHKHITTQHSIDFRLVMQFVK